MSKKHQEAIHIFSVKEGQESQAYWYRYHRKKYIIRINPVLEGFKKDWYAFLHFSSDTVLIPRIFEIGEYDDTCFYCISAKAEGETYQDSSKETVKRLLPDITRILLAISETDLAGTTGYGKFDSATGNAPFSSWKMYLLDILDDKKFNWNEIKRKTFINGTLIDEITEEFRTLVPFCPETRNLIHGDFGSNNLLVGAAPAFTGVIDWDCAAYGDFLYDVATAYFWRTWLMCMAETAAYWGKTFCGLPNYDKRIRCYALSIGLNEIFENARENNAAFTIWLQDRCKELLGKKH